MQKIKGFKIFLRIDKTKIVLMLETKKTISGAVLQEMICEKLVMKNEL
ncbi:hypothetical protein NLG42_11990 [Flavobacterium plurextorum]|nr:MULTISPECIES: hypothetical protein [Flavobacterium]UUW11503.1 hypothetical protein NLG42_11990 [Flavobacterium plurextorum]